MTRRTAASTASAATQWAIIKSGSPRAGLAGLVRAAHDKKLAYPEWALATPSSFNGHGNGDNPYFVQQFYNFLKAHNVAYETYFDTDHSPNIHQPQQRHVDEFATSRRPVRCTARCSTAPAPRR